RARDGRQRRRAHRHRRRLPGEGDGGPGGGGGRSGRPRRRFRARGAGCGRCRVGSAARAAACARGTRVAATAAPVRSEITIDLAALRHNVRTIQHALDGAELWAVVKADAYGHGAIDCARAALESGASALCVATVPEALALRAVFPEPRVLVMGPAWPGELEA